MGTISSVKANRDNTLQVTLEMSQREYEELQGAMDNVFLFAMRNAGEETKLVSRGKSNSSKYFLAPKSHRKLVTSSDSVPVQTIETKTHYHIIYSNKKYS